LYYERSFQKLLFFGDNTETDMNLSKTPLALALATLTYGASLSATAQTSVTLYGIVDAGVTHVTGLRGGSTTRVTSGNFDGSRFGLRGTEDLGDGYKATFVFENRFEADTGGISNRPFSGTQVPDRLYAGANGATLVPGAPAAVQAAAAQVVRGVYDAALSTGSTSLANTSYGVNLPGRFFDRQIFAGLITPVGAVLAGRQYTPAFATFANYDITGTSSALSPGQLATIPALLEIRESNTVQYVVDTSGIRASLMYGAGEVSGNSKNGRLLGANLSYTSPNTFSVGAGYNERTNELGEKSLRTAVVGAYGVLGAFKLSGLVASFKDDNPNGISALRTGVVNGVTQTINGTAALAGLVPLAGQISAAAGQSIYDAFKQDGQAASLGLEYKAGSHKVWLAYNRYNDKRAVDADVDSYGVAYMYSLSQRTSFYTSAVQFKNSETAQSAPGGNGYLGGVTESAGKDSVGVSLGLQHRF
jgi:predicted porin